jgi:Ca2+-binding RTX toxin-like protein
MSRFQLFGFRGGATAWTFGENLVNAAPQRIAGNVEPILLLDRFGSGPAQPFAIRVEGLGPDDRVTLQEARATASQGVFLDGGLVYLNGRIVGAATGGDGTPFQVTFGWETILAVVEGNASTIERVLEALAYRNVSDTPQPSRDLALRVGVVTGDGVFDPIDTDVVTVNVQAQPDPPRLILPAGPLVLAEEAVNGGPQPLLPGALFTGDLAGKVRLVVSGLAPGDIIGVAGTGDGPGEIGFDGQLLRFEGAVIGDILPAEPGSFVIGLRPEVPATAVQALLRALTFANGSDAPAAERHLAIDLLDEHGSLLAATVPPAFALADPGQHPFGNPDVGRHAVPTLVDLDGDGRLDLVVGAEDGRLQAWRNTGDGFVPLLGGDNPFDGIDPGRFSAPAFLDLTGDGRPDLVLGAEDKILRAWENLPGGFKPLDGLGGPFTGAPMFQQEGRFPFSIFPFAADVFGDGRPELVVARGFDGFTLVWTPGASGLRLVLPQETTRLPELPFLGTPGFLDVNGDGLAEVFVASEPLLISGDYVELPLGGWDGASEIAAPRPVAGNPLAGIRGRNAAFGDLDGDGDTDLVVGRVDGTLDVYLNLAERPGVVVRVSPQNDPPTGITLSGSGRIAENAAPGTVVGLLSTIDPDPSDSFAFTLLGDAGGRFALQGAALVVAGPIDFETAAEHRLTLRATDAGGFPVERHIVVAVDDVPGLLQAGGPGADSLAGTPEADTLLGSDGSDTLGGLGGDDRIDGGRGSDTVLFSGLREDYRITAVGGGFVLADGRAGAPDGADTVLGAEVFRFADGDATADRLRLGDATPGADTRSGTKGPDSIDGGEGDDVLRGLDGADSLSGDAGADLLRGDGGADTLAGGEGGDSLIGGAGDERMEGGAGNDRYWVDDAGDVVVEAPGGGLDLVTTTLDALTLAAEVENLSRNGVRDFAGTGNALDNILRGNAGRDLLEGLGGKDRLVGGGGADTLTGGLGADVLTGGAEADVFRYDSAAEGGDRIADYDPAEDGIAISAASFGGGLLAGTDLLATGRYVERLSGVATSAAGTGQFIYETDARRLWWDADGAGGAAAKHIATLSGIAAFGAAEIVLI